MIVTKQHLSNWKVLFSFPNKNIKKRRVFMKNIFMKSMTVLTLLLVALYGVNQGKTEAASKPANQDLIIINKS